MKPTELLAKLVDKKASDEWYVTDGATAIGPVGLELLARGITAGKVPREAFVRHASWESWRGLADLAEQNPSFDPRRTLSPLRAPRKEPPRQTLPSIDVVADDEDLLDEVVDDTSRDAFDRAADLPEALLMLMAAAVKRCEAEAALVHRAVDNVATVVCSHGPRMFQMLGDKLQVIDPVLSAAKKGLLVFSEPSPGVAGRATRTRLSRLGTAVEAAFMVPLVVDGRLLALIELGRTKPFRALDAADVEALVDEVVAMIKRANWPLDSPPPPKRAP